MKTFYFNTGVRPENVINFPYEYHNKVGNKIHGTLVIPFDCKDVPENAIFQFACDNDIPGYEHLLKKEIFNSNLCSKYAYFLLP
jgi:hypothetical protein